MTNFHGSQPNACLHKKNLISSKVFTWNQFPWKTKTYRWDILESMEKTNVRLKQAIPWKLIPLKIMQLNTTKDEKYEILDIPPEKKCHARWHQWVKARWTLF